MWKEDLKEIRILPSSEATIRGMPFSSITPVDVDVSIE